MSIQKKWFQLFVALIVLAALLASCAPAAPATQDDNTASAKPESTSTPEPEETAAPAEPVEFTVWFAKSNYAQQYKFDGNDKISKWIMDNKNVKINFEGPTGDWKQVYNVMLASNDLPDCIRGLGTGNEYLQTIELGKLVPLDDYMNQYEGYRSMFTQHQIDIMKVDGKSYTMVNWGHTEGTISGGNGGWGYNDQVYEQLGAPKLTNLDELYEYLVNVKKANIKVNDQTIIPLQSSTHSGILGSFSMVWSAFGEGRAPGDLLDRMVVDKDGSLTFVMEDEKLLEALQYVNRLYREGLINQDCFVEKDDQVDEKILMGRAAVYADASFINHLGKSMNKILSSGDTSVSYTAIEPIAANGVNQKEIYTDNQRSVGSGITITTSAENPEAIYAYHDWAVTPEGQYTIGFGPEGELWESGSDGMPVLKDGKSLILSPEELSQLPIYAFFTIGHSNTYNEAKMAINRTLPENERDWLIAAQDQFSFRHTKDVTEFVNVDTDVDTDEAIIYVDSREILKEAFINMITAENEDAVKTLYDNTKEQIYSTGFDKVIKVLDEKWKANKDILGTK